MNTITDLPFGDDLIIPETTTTTAKPTHWDKYPSILPHLAAEEYHRHPAVSKHGLDAFRKAPALYVHERKTHKDPTPAMLFGSLYHTVILEPEKAEAEWMVMPECDRRTKDGKALWESAMLTLGNRRPIKKDDMDKAHAMRAALQNHTTAWNAVNRERRHVEASLFWDDPATAVKCRARPDLIRNDGFIVDLKTCADASLDDFTRSAFNFGYHRQAAFYLDAWHHITGEKPKGFIFVAQEKEPPFLTAVYVASPAMIEAGRAEIAVDLARFRECQLADTWPGLPLTPQELNLPAWAMPKA